ncbi:glycoside hydrolase family 15 protein [Candidatus Omnitrophota bacterium]
MLDWQVGKKRIFTKVVAILMAQVFLVTNLGYAAPSGRSLFKDKRPNYKAIQRERQDTLQKKQDILSGKKETKKPTYDKALSNRIKLASLKDLSSIYIPATLGRVTEAYEGPRVQGEKDRLIVHIQDLHTNPEAQLNLASILELLIKDYDLDLVCSEGADGIVDTSSVSSFPDFQVREKTARLFIDSGELTGEEYLSITKYPDLLIWGIEDRDIYFKNIIEFNRIMKFSASSQVFISQTKKALTELKPKIYSKELLALDKRHVDFKDGTIKTDEYLKDLTSYVKRLNIPTQNYKNITLLTETMEEEKNIDHARITEESQGLVLNLRAALSGKTLRKTKDSLMVKSELFKDQKISPFSFYSYLKDLALKHLPDKLAKYPNLNNFVDYLTKVNSLDSTKLFNEIEDLTYEIKNLLSRTPEEKTFTKALRNTDFLEGFFSLKVSNEELDYYLENRASHKVKFFEDFMKPTLKKYNLSSFIDFNPSLIDPYLQELEDFYKTVKDRDIAMVENSLSQIEKRDAKVATLIAGGFHTKGITSLLRDRGYSYIVVSPYSSTDIDEENYHFLLSGKRKPISELLLHLGETLKVMEAFASDEMIDEWNEDIRFKVAEATGEDPEDLKIEKGRHRFWQALLPAFFASALKNKRKNIAGILSGWSALQDFATQTGFSVKLSQGQRAFTFRYENPQTGKVEYSRVRLDENDRPIYEANIPAKYFTGRQIGIAGVKVAEKDSILLGPQHMGFLELPVELQREFSSRLAQLPQGPTAALAHLINTEGSSADIFEAQLEGVDEVVAVKVYRNPLVDDWQYGMDYFLQEIKGIQLYERLGIGPKFYGVVDVNGNPAFAMELIKGVHAEQLTTADAHELITEERIQQARMMARKIIEAGYRADDAQFLIVTQDGHGRRRGDIVFIDPGSVRPLQGDSIDNPDRIVQKIEEELRFALQPAVIKETIGLGRAHTFDELYAALDSLGGLQGKREYHPSSVLKAMIEEVRQGRRQLAYITRTHGLRYKVIQLIMLEESAVFSTPKDTGDGRGRGNEALSELDQTEREIIQARIDVVKSDLSNIDTAEEALEQAIADENGERISETLASLQSHLSTALGNLDEVPEKFYPEKSDKIAETASRLEEIQAIKRQIDLVNKALSEIEKLKEELDGAMVDRRVDDRAEKGIPEILDRLSSHRENALGILGDVPIEYFPQREEIQDYLSVTLSRRIAIFLPDTDGALEDIGEGDAKPLKRNGVTYGEFDPNTNEIVIDIENSRRAFKIVAPELGDADSHKVTGFVHAHELFHALVKKLEISLDEDQEERLADIFAKRVFGFALTKEEEDLWEKEVDLNDNLGRADIARLANIRYDETTVAITDNEAYGIRQGDSVETGRFLLEVQRILGDGIYKIKTSKLAEAKVDLEDRKRRQRAHEGADIDRSMEGGLRAMARRTFKRFRRDRISEDEIRKELENLFGKERIAIAFEKDTYKARKILDSISNMGIEEFRELIDILGKDRVASDLKSPDPVAPYWLVNILDDVSEMGIEEFRELVDLLGKDRVTSSLERDRFEFGRALHKISQTGVGKFKKLIEKIKEEYAFLLDTEGIFNKQHSEEARLLLGRDLSMKTLLAKSRRDRELKTHLLAILLIYQNSFSFLDREEYDALVIKILTFAYFDENYNTTDASFRIGTPRVRPLSKEFFIGMLAHEVAHNFVPPGVKGPVEEFITDSGNFSVFEGIGWGTMIPYMQKDVLGYTQLSRAVFSDSQRLARVKIQEVSEELERDGLPIAWSALFRLSMEIAREEPGLEFEDFINMLLERYSQEIRTIGREEGVLAAETEGRRPRVPTIESSDPKTVKRNLMSFEYEDPSQDFLGVDMEHFVVAQRRLAKRILPPQILGEVLEKLGLSPELGGERAYPVIYRKLADGNYTKEIIDLINSDSEGNSTYADPRLGVSIVGQNPNPRAQGVYEAVSNSLDALGLKIGQFGKGVKQIVDWLEMSGTDRIDVFTSQASQAGIAYQLTILKDTKGQMYLQIKQIGVETFQEAAGEPYEQGTVVRVTTSEAIPRTDQDRDLEHRNSQAGIAEGVHRRFAYVPSVRVSTKTELDAKPQTVNGFEEKEVIVPSGIPRYRPEDSADRKVHVALTDNTITIVDNGFGMDSEIFSRMFVPEEGTKTPQPLSGEAAQVELTNVMVVHDPTLPHRISFARNGEVIFAPDATEDILEDATVPGGLMVEMGSLLDVPESRDQIIIPLDLKPGERSNFELAMEYAINQLINHPELSVASKARLINTIVVGLDSLVQGNENYAHVVRAIRANAQKGLTSAGLIEELRREGFVILPHNKQFAQVAIPEDKKVFFLHEHLFDWKGVINLKEIGAEVVPGFTLRRPLEEDRDREVELPLMVTTFTEEAVKGVTGYEASEDIWMIEDKLPIVETDRFIAIPVQLGARLLELAKKRVNPTVTLTEKEAKDFTSLAQLVNTLTAKAVVTSYEVTKPRENVVLAPQIDIEESIGEIDSDAVNGFNRFLREPPILGLEVSRPGTERIPTDSNQRYVLLENGDLMEIGTGEIVTSDVQAIEPLINGYYKLTTTEDNVTLDRLVKLEGGAMQKFGIGMDSEADIFINRKIGIILTSPGKKFAYLDHHPRVGEPRFYQTRTMIDLETGIEYCLETGFSVARGADEFSRTLYNYNLQFSQDGKYLTYLERSEEEGVNFIVVDLEARRQVLKENLFRAGIDYEIEYAINPFANVVFIKIPDIHGPDDVKVIDLASGFKRVVRYARTDSTGTYTSMIGRDGKMSVYFHDLGRLFTNDDFGGKQIISATTFWKDEETIFAIEIEGPHSFQIDTRSGRATLFSRPEEDEDHYSETFTRRRLLLFMGMKDRAMNLDIAFDAGFEHEDIDRLDPLQRLDRPCVYKHPDFELVIDNSYPDNPVAVNPETDRRLPYKGRIISHNWVNREERDFRQDFITFRKGSTATNYHIGGHKGEPRDKAELERYIRDGASTYEVILDMEPGHFLWSIPLDSGRSQYVVRQDVHPRSPMEVIPKTIAREAYPQVSFDGKYFLFSNPKTGDVAYYELQHVAPGDNTNKPIFVSGKKAFLDEKPADAPNRYVILEDEAGGDAIGDDASGVYIYDTETKSRVVLAQDYQQLRRINRDTFAGETEKLLNIFKIENGTIGGSRFYPGEEKPYIVEHSDELVVLGLVEHERVLDVRDMTYVPIEMDKRPEKVSISASGRFSVHKDPDGELVYYDHEEENPVPKVIYDGFYEEYLVHDLADVVIIKNMDGKYTLYNLSLGKLHLPAYDHIEIDSSGKTAIGVDTRWQGALHTIDLISGETLVNGAVKGIRLASDETGYYMIWEYGLSIGPRAYRYNPEGAEDNWDWFGKPEEVELPRFWESYDLGQKTIWDRERDETNYALTVSGGYQGHPPTSTVATASLIGSTLIKKWYAGSEFKVSVKDLETGMGPGNSFIGSGPLHAFGSLQGGQVWYRTARAEGSQAVLNVAILTGETFDFEEQEGLVNQTRTFILGRARDSLDYILIDGEGNVNDITSQIPFGFVPTEANGEYFVFVSPETGKIKYLTPHVISTSKDIEMEELSPEERRRQEQALEIWNAQIVARRDEFIAQARRSYRPFLELVPEEYRREIEQRVKEEIDKLYKVQQEAIQRRFQKAVQENQELDIDTPLPFDKFAQRMERIVQRLPGYLESVEGPLLQERFSLQKDFYLNLFIRLFEVSKNPNLKLSEEVTNEKLFEVLALDWQVDTQEQLDAVPLIAQLIIDLRELSYGQIELAEIKAMIEFLSYAASRGPPETIEIVTKQLGKILHAKPGVKERFLTTWRGAFRQIDHSILRRYLDDPDQPIALGDARPFAVFLTNDIAGQIRQELRVVPEGQDGRLPYGGIGTSQMVSLEEQRPKKDPDDVVMDIEYLLDRIRDDVEGREKLPPLLTTGEATVLRNATKQAESGASAREIPQNSKDAGAKELIVDFFLQLNELGQEEYVEEARDDGTGALQEVALLIPKSTKAIGEQIDLEGFYGTGKYTIFEGVDRLEIITKNEDRAFMFTYTVEKDTSGNPTSIRLTRIRRITDPSLMQGVTVRRIKIVSNTIPELDQMLSMRAWKSFAGLSQDDNFKIFFKDHEGEKGQLKVDYDVLSQTTFKAIRPGEGSSTSFGTMRIMSTKDMPVQVVSKAGFRVGEIKEEYLALIPSSLRDFIKELGIVIQIPLPLIRTRSGFEHEQEYLPVIQKYVAIEFYKAIAYKTLTQRDPPFVFEDFPSDWETNNQYWDSISYKDSMLVKLAENINQGRYEAVTEEDLSALVVKSGERDREKKLIRLLVLLEVSTDPSKPDERTSLFLRRLAIQQEINEAKARFQAETLEKLGLSTIKIPSLSDVPDSTKKLFQARALVTLDEQMRKIEDFIIDPGNYSDRDKELINLARPIVELLGLEQVILVSQDVVVNGVFTIYKGKSTMILNRSLANRLGQPGLSILDVATDAVNHELAHFGEELERTSNRDKLLEKGYVSHEAGFTHQPVGTFADNMKYVAARWLWLSNQELPAPDQEKPPLHFEALLLKGERNDINVSREVEARPERERILVRGVGIKDAQDKDVDVFEMTEGELDELKRALNLSEGELGALIHKAFSTLERSGITTDSIRDTKILIALLEENASKRLFEDHRENNFIGINRTFLDIAKENPELARILFTVGLAHELRHEAGLTEEDLQLDAEFFYELMREQGLGNKEFYEFRSALQNYLNTTDFIDTVESIIASRQKEASIRRALGNCKDNGAIVVTGEETHDYSNRHWVRDSSRALRMLTRLYKAADGVVSKDELRAKIDKLREFSRFGKGYAKYDAETGEPDLLWSPNPQHDGPALRSVALIEYCEELLKEGKIEQVKEIYSDIRLDLEYIVDNWHKKCFDLWEDILAHHFFTDKQMRAALVRGSKLATALTYNEDTERYKDTAASLKERIERYYNEEEGFIVSFLDPEELSSEDLNSAPTSLEYKNRQGLDISGILGSIYAYDVDDSVGRIEELDLREVEMFRDEYRHDQAWSKKVGVGFGIGRFPEDYYSGDTVVYEKRPEDEKGNPWFITTLGVSQYYARLARVFLERYKEGGNEDDRKKAMKAYERSTDFFRWSLAHIPLDGSMSEQINRDTGEPQGVRDLTWSHAEFVHAMMEREEFEEKLQGEPSLSRNLFWSILTDEEKRIARERIATLQELLPKIIDHIVPQYKDSIEAVYIIGSFLFKENPTDLDLVAIVRDEVDYHSKEGDFSEEMKGELRERLGINSRRMFCDIKIFGKDSMPSVQSRESMHSVYFSMVYSNGVLLSGTDLVIEPQYKDLIAKAKDLITPGNLMSVKGSFVALSTLMAQRTAGILKDVPPEHIREYMKLGILYDHATTLGEGRIREIFRIMREINAFQPIPPLVQQLIAKADDEIGRSVKARAVPFYSNQPGFTAKYLTTKNISSENLPYPTHMRDPKTAPVPHRIVDVNMPDDVDGVFLLGKEHGGSNSYVRLGYLEDGRPVAIRTHLLFNDFKEDVHKFVALLREYQGLQIADDLRSKVDSLELTSSETKDLFHGFLKDYQSALILDELGIGPSVHGIFVDGEGNPNIVMDVVPGDFPKVVPEFITAATFRDLRGIQDRLARRGLAIVDEDFQYYVTPEGRIQIIDPGSIGPAGEVDEFLLSLVDLLFLADTREIKIEALREIIEEEPALFSSIYDEVMTPGRWIHGGVREAIEEVRGEKPTLAERWDEDYSHKLSERIVDELALWYWRNWPPYRSDLRHKDKSYGRETWVTLSGIGFIRVGFLFFLDDKSYDLLSDDLKQDLSNNVILVNKLSKSIIATQGVNDSLGLHTIVTMLLLFETDLDGVRFVDMGAGDGMLSLVAAKLGAGKVILCEKNPDRLNEARLNLQLNGLKENEDFFLLEVDLMKQDKFREKLDSLKLMPMRTVVASNIGGIVVKGGDIVPWDSYNATNITNIALIPVLIQGGSIVTDFIGAGYVSTTPYENKHEKRLLSYLELGFLTDPEKATLKHPDGKKIFTAWRASRPDDKLRIVAGGADIDLHVRGLLEGQGIGGEYYDDIISAYDDIEALESRINEILGVIEEIERNVGVEGFKMPDPSRRAILKTYLNDRERPVSPETVVQRPLLDNSIDPEKAEEWITAHPPKLQELARFIIDHITYINQEEFEAALEKSVEKFNDNNKGRPYIVVLRRKLLEPEGREEDPESEPTHLEKSNAWVDELAREKGLPPAEEVLYVSKDEEIQENIGEFIEEGYDIVIIDDVAYSPQGQLYVMIDKVLSKMEKEGITEEVNLHIIIPFITREAEATIKVGFSENKNVHIQLYKQQNIDTIIDIFNAAIQEDRDKEKLYFLMSEIYREHFINNKTLSYFQHKIADRWSIVAEILHGGFIPETKPPYEKDYLEWARRSIKETKAGNLIGKLFIKEGGKLKQVKENIIATEENGDLVLYYKPYRSSRRLFTLYTEDKNEARVKLLDETITTKSGQEIRLIEDNTHIRGFGDRDNIYIAESLQDNPIAIFHELKEAYYAGHPDELPEGVNPHTFLRGCGKDVRRAYQILRQKGENQEGKNPFNMTEYELIERLRQVLLEQPHLTRERLNQAEFALIRYNAREGRIGIERLYGLQDVEFGMEANDRFSLEERLSKLPSYLREEKRKEYAASLELQVKSVDELCAYLNIDMPNEIKTIFHGLLDEESITLSSLGEWMSAALEQFRTDKGLEKTLDILRDLKVKEEEEELEAEGIGTSDVTRDGISQIPVFALTEIAKKGMLPGVDSIEYGSISLVHLIALYKVYKKELEEVDINHIKALYENYRRRLESGINRFYQSLTLKDLEDLPKDRPLSPDDMLAKLKEKTKELKKGDPSKDRIIDDIVFLAGMLLRGEEPTAEELQRLKASLLSDYEYFVTDYRRLQGAVPLYPRLLRDISEKFPREHKVFIARDAGPFYETDYLSSRSGSSRSDSSLIYVSLQNNYIDVREEMLRLGKGLENLSLKDFERELREGFEGLLETDPKFRRAARELYRQMDRAGILVHNRLVIVDSWGTGATTSFIKLVAEHFSEGRIKAKLFIVREKENNFKQIKGSGLSYAEKVACEFLLSPIEAGYKPGKPMGILFSYLRAMMTYNAIIEDRRRLQDVSPDVRALNALLRAIDEQAHELGFDSQDLLRGSILDVGLEAPKYRILKTDLVNSLRAQDKDVVGLSPEIEDGSEPVFYKGIVQDMPFFADGKFDLVISFGLFNEEYFGMRGMHREGFKDAKAFYERAAEEISRVLKPDGRFLVRVGIIAPNPEFIPAFENAGFHVRVLQGSTGGYVLVKSSATDAAPIHMAGRGIPGDASDTETEEKKVGPGETAQEQPAPFDRFMEMFFMEGTRRLKGYKGGFAGLDDEKDLEIRRENLEAVIEDLSDNERGVAIVLGAGANQVSQLVKAFKRVILVDLDKDALEFAYNSVPEALRGRVEIRQSDVSGMVREFCDRIEEIRNGPSDYREVVDAYIALLRDTELYVGAWIETMEQDSADLVLAERVYSQLPLSMVEYAYQELFVHHDLPQAKKSGYVINAERFFQDEVRMTFVRNLGTLSKTSGLIYFSDTVTYKDIQEDNFVYRERDVDRDAESAGLEELDILPHKKWQWRVNKYAKNTRHMIARVFQKPASREARELTPVLFDGRNLFEQGELDRVGLEELGEKISKLEANEEAVIAVDNEDQRKKIEDYIESSKDRHYIILDNLQDKTMQLYFISLLAVHDNEVGKEGLRLTPDRFEDARRHLDNV